MNVDDQRDPAFRAEQELDLNSQEAIFLSLGEWAEERQKLLDPIIGPFRDDLCREIAEVLRIFKRDSQNRIVAFLYALAGQSCADLESAWQSLRHCCIRTAHAAMRSSLEAAMTAVTFLDPEDGLSHFEGYVSDEVRVSGVILRFRRTARRIGVSEAEVDNIASNMQEFLNPLTHPSLHSIRATMSGNDGRPAMGNYFFKNQVDDYRIIAKNILICARQIRTLLQSADQNGVIPAQPQA